MKKYNKTMGLQELLEEWFGEDGYSFERFSYDPITRLITIFGITKEDK